ncbi:MAG: WYL domain-containing protein [Candidatus Brocadiia bacterium]|jgi:proteasome accessory factor B
MVAISKSERLLNLVSFLLKSRRPVSFAKIRESVVGYRDERGNRASLERRFERDKAALRELGVPLKFEAEDETGEAGYVLPREAYFLPHVQLSPSEAAILALAGRFLLTGAAGPVSDALRSALRKLQFDSPIPGQIRETAEEHFLFHRLGAPAAAGEPATVQDQANLRQLTTAVLNRRAVQFSYYAIGNDRLERRTAEPYGIGFSNGHWYLVANDRARKDIRVFRTDRIRGAVARVHLDSLQPEYELPPGFRVQDHVGMPPWLFGKATRTAVRIRFDADVAFMVRLRPSPGDQWEEQQECAAYCARPDGSAILTRQATHLDSLLHWVLGFAHHAEVLDPPEFRARVAEALQAMAEAHAI